MDSFMIKTYAMQYNDWEINKNVPQKLDDHIW